MSQDALIDGLLADYVAVRDDERELANQQIALFGAVVTTLTLLGALVTAITRSDPNGVPDIPDIVADASPLIPLSLICLLQIIGSQATVRSFYARALERELRSRLSAPSSMGGYPDLPPLSYREIMDTLNSLSGGRRIPRLLAFIVFASIGVVFIGLVVYMALSFSGYLQFAMFIIYGSATVLLLVETRSATIRGRRYFDSVVGDCYQRRREPLTPLPLSLSPNHSGRSMVGYLVIPRPMDLVAKCCFFPLGAWLAIILEPSIATSEHFWPRFLLLWFVTDFIVYQARYQINDLRGLAEDEGAPAADGRGRIPQSGRDIRTIVALVLVAVIVRAFAAILIASVGYLSIVRDILPIFAVVAGLAILYERLRQVERGRYKSELPANVDRADTTSWLVAGAVCVVVGFGYPARALLGMLLPSHAFNGNAGPFAWVVINVALFAAALGVLFVSMTWCLEGGSYVDGRQSDTYLLDEAVRAKPHLDRMLRNLHLRFRYLHPSETTVSPNCSSEKQGQVKGQNLRWLLSPAVPWSWWNTSAVISASLAAPLAISLWTPQPSTTMVGSATAIVVVIHLIGVVLAARRPGNGEVPGQVPSHLWISLATWLALVFSVAVAFVAAQLLLHRDAQVSALVISGQIVVTIAVLVAPAGIYVFFTLNTYSGLQLKLPKWLHWRSALVSMLRVVIGSTTADKCGFTSAGSNIEVPAPTVSVSGVARSTATVQK